MTEEAAQSSQGRRDQHIMWQANHFVIKDGRLQIRSPDQVSSTNYRIIPYNELNRPSLSDYSKETIKKLNHEVEGLKKERRHLLDQLEQEQQRIRGLEVQVEKGEKPGNSSVRQDGDRTKRHLYMQFMYSESEVQRIRRKYQQKIRALDRKMIEEADKIQSEKDGKDQIIKNQLKIIESLSENIYEQSRSNMNTPMRKILGDSRVSHSGKRSTKAPQSQESVKFPKPISMNLNFGNLKQQNKNSLMGTSILLSDFSKSNPSTARKRTQDNENEIDMIVDKENQFVTKRKYCVKTARVSTGQRIKK